MTAQARRGPRWVAYLLLLGALPASADDPDAVITFTCDLQHGELLIEESFDEQPEGTPYPRAIKPEDTRFSIRGLMWADETGDEVVWRERRIQRSCKLGKNLFVVTFAGYKSNPNVQGYCGAGTPTAALTISRDDTPIAENLVLHERCDAVHEIESLRIITQTQEISALVSSELTRESAYVRLPIKPGVTRAAFLDRAASAASLPRKPSG